jgi:hypothetical protein
MEEKKSGGSGCLKIAGFGCLAILGLALLASLLVGGLVVSSSRGDDNWVAATLREEKIEPANRRTPATAEQVADARTGIDLPTDLALTGAASSHLTLELTGGSFELRAHDGDTVEVEGDFDEDLFTLRQETTVEDDGSQAVTIHFAPQGRARFINNTINRLTVLVPRNTPFVLDGKIQMGESDLDLGGLTLRDVDLELAMGDHRIEVSEPTRGVLERFAVQSRMGAVRYEGLGNASPLGVELRHRMGELRLDLDGAWLGDAAISMRCSMGECTATLPDTVRADVDASATMGGRTVNLPDTSDLPADAPTLFVRARVLMGEVGIH